MGFLTKFFSTDSAVSRCIRGIVLGLATGGATQFGIHLPPWASALLGVIAGTISAGQPNSSTKNVPPHI